MIVITNYCGKKYLALVLYLALVSVSLTAIKDRLLYKVVINPSTLSKIFLPEPLKIGKPARNKITFVFASFIARLQMLIL